VKSVPSKRVVLGMLAFGIGLGFLNNIAYGEPWAWHGFFFGVLGGVFGLFLYTQLDPPDEP
jgi:hypothetical protein